ncbi:MAG: hypothetical protein HUU29_00415 [Planctomycetaceae bacterium]|nr:hypothetical protein [Planctomycetaceae bacterium]
MSLIQFAVLLIAVFVAGALNAQAGGGGGAGGNNGGNAGGNNGGGNKDPDDVTKGGKYDKLVTVEFKDVASDLPGEDARKGKIIVLAFSGEKEQAPIVHVLLDSLVDRGDVFCLYVKDDEEKAKERKARAKEKKKQPQDKFAFPVCRFDASDLYEAYDVDKAGAFVVTDANGNPYKTITSANTLGKTCTEVVKWTEQQEKELGGLLAKAATAFEAGKYSTSLSNIEAAVKKAHFGENSKKIEELFNSVLRKGEELMNAAVEKGDKKALDSLAKEFKGTYLEERIKEAGKEASAPDKNASAPAAGGDDKDGDKKEEDEDIGPPSDPYGTDKKKK